MTALDKPVRRVTAKIYQRRRVIVTLAPCGGQSEARIGFRLQGKRTQYVCTLTALYNLAALWHGNKEKAARREARKNGVPWRVAKQKFIADNSI